MVLGGGGVTFIIRTPNLMFELGVSICYKSKKTFTLLRQFNMSMDINRNAAYLIYLDGLVFQPNTVTMGPCLPKYTFKNTLLLSLEIKRMHFGPPLCYCSPKPPLAAKQNNYLENSGCNLICLNCLGR